MMSDCYRTVCQSRTIMVIDVLCCDQMTMPRSLMRVDRGFAKAVPLPPQMQKPVSS